MRPRYTIYGHFFDIYRWEVPLPGMVQYLYSYARSEGTDPRFVKLEPIFRSSMVKCGDRQR